MLALGLKSPISVCAWCAFVTVWFTIQPAGLSFGAGSILDTGGFETGYIHGPLQGQLGWLTAGHGGGTATVQGTTTESGANAVQVDRGANSDDRWAVPVTVFPMDRYVYVDWDMNVTATGAGSSVFGPFFGVDTYDATVSPNVLGSLGVDATTGDVVYQLESSGNIADTGEAVTFGQWHHFQIRLDFQTDQYDVYFDDALLASTGFVDGPRDNFTDADIAAFALAFNAVSQSQTGTAYFDNFLIREVVPGDYNSNGVVDAADYAVWLDALGSPGPLPNDPLGGTIGQAHYDQWKANFGSGVASGSGSGAGTSIAVPEPSSLALALFSLSFFCHRRRL